MAGKTLSNGTLSLRFMQNAQRAKLQAHVEIEQAKVIDDAEWSVSQEVRDAWGLSESSKREDDMHESSYLPFMFNSDKGEGSSSNSQLDGTPLFRGRRTFNAKGKEVVAEPPKIKEEGEVDSSSRLQRPRSRFEPTSISGFNAPIASTRTDGKKIRTKTAQELIRESTSIGAPASFLNPDEEVKPNLTSPITHSKEFLKPAGVDEPGALGARKRDREHAPSTRQDGKRRKKETNS